MDLPTILKKLKDNFGFIVAVAYGIPSINRSIGILDLYIVIAWILFLYIFTDWGKETKESLSSELFQGEAEGLKIHKGVRQKKDQHQPQSGKPKGRRGRR